MQNKIEILVPETTYHVFNRANGNEKVFLTDKNYTFFLEKYRGYIPEIADTFCYCLMPNHFHFIIRIKSEGELEKHFKSTLTGFKTLSGLNESALSKLITQPFSHLLNGYAQAINKQEKRKGSLFMRPFKRKRITDENYLRKLVYYIHYNPVEAGLAASCKEWQYSSYNALISTSPTLIAREEVIEWFDDLGNFIYCHKYPPQETGIEYL